LVHRIKRVRENAKVTVCRIFVRYSRLIVLIELKQVLEQIMERI